MAYPKLTGYDLKQLRELVQRNGWKNVQLSLDDIRNENAAQPSVQRTGLCDHQWLASTLDGILCICTVCGEVQLRR